MFNFQALWTAFMTHDHSGQPRKGKAIPGAVPSGTIVLWNSSLASIPAGWVMCSGGSAPDLRNRFVKGAGAGYAEGVYGGTDTHNFWHGHGLPVSVATAGNHQHLSPASGTGTGGEVWATDTNHGGGLDFYHTHPGIWSTAAGEHGHGVNSQSVAGNLGSVDNRQWYFTLAYIMKL